MINVEPSDQLGLQVRPTLLSHRHLFYQTHFHFYFNDVTGFSHFIVAK